MAENEKVPFSKKLHDFFIGKPRSIRDRSIFQHISLIAFFAWVGLGSDGLSSANYGPAEAFAALQSHYYLGIFIAIASAVTIFVISSSYSQIIELFPEGGGGYLVASQLLSRRLGMFAGCALLIDYVLTITVSVASGSDAIFSFLPAAWLAYKNFFSLAVLLGLIVMNLRGVKESVMPLIPIFITFVVTHAFAIIYSVTTHAMMVPQVAAAIKADVSASASQIGILGMILLMLRAYSMGAGTYTGIEAVSNGMSILREPKVQTGKRTMRYMAFSLAFMVIGLTIAYLLYRVVPVEGKTLNAVLFERVAGGWQPSWGLIFIMVSLVSAALILFVAAQTGFLGGPRVLANMAVDGWMPKRFALLSDRLVTGNGVLIMGVAAIGMLFLSRGSVTFLVVLYSINVFITFFLSQLGMVKHWWQSRQKEARWVSKISVVGFGFVLTAFILISVSVIKFHEGGWLTLSFTAILAAFCGFIKYHYNKVERAIRKLESSVMENVSSVKDFIPTASPSISFDPQANTAVFFVKNFNAIGIQTISRVLNSFKDVFKNVLFVQVGLINAGTFTHIGDVEEIIKCEIDRYVSLMKSTGYFSEGFCLTGIDTVEEMTKIVPTILKTFPNAVFFGGQVVFPRDTILSRLMHNYTLFSIQQQLFEQGVPFYVVPVKI